jgi:hypothetical protein
MMNLNDDLNLSNISRIISNNNSIQDDFFSESFEDEEKVKIEYHLTSEVINEKKEQKVTQNNPDNLYKNCENIEHEIKEVSCLSNKIVLKSCKKLTSERYPNAIFNIGIGYNSFCLNNCKRLSGKSYYPSL